MARVEGLDELMHKLKALPDDLGKNPLDQAMRKGARLWVNAAKANLSGRSRGVKNSRTGNIRLADSIALRKDSDPKSNGFDARYEVGYRAKAFWGAFVELGTEKQTAAPFLRPAFDENERQIVDTIAAELRSSIERLAR